MQTTKFSLSAKQPIRLLRTAMTLALSVALMACGGGGTTPITDVTTSPGGLRTLSNDGFISRKAVNYSPYRDSKTNEDRPNEDVTDAEVLQDLTLLKAAGFGLVRIFDSDEKVAQRVLRVLDNNKQLDIKVYLGMWMAGNNDAGNKDQMARGVALANSYPNTVVAVSVGNESLVSWSGHKIPVEELAANIKTVREQIKQPVTTDDNWAYYAAADRAILDVIDFAAVHTYAMVDTHYLPLAQQWNWKQLEETDLTKRAAAMMDAAMVATKADYQAARTNLDKKGLSAMPIVIGETGWMNKDPGDGWYRFLAHPVNQKMYFDRLSAWANEGKTGSGPKNVFYFEAFDEPWKGKDDGWGLFNVKREARCAAQSLNAAATWVKEAGSCDVTNAIYFKPATINSAVTQTNYLIYTEAVTGFTPAGLRWDPFVKTFWQPVADAAPGDGTESYEIDPRPETWGWGMLYQSATTPPITENLSEFASGSIHVSIKTLYAGKIELGISTDTEQDGAQEAFLQISNGQYGYCNTGAWCNLTIPVKDFVTANPKLDLRLVLSRFVIADRFEFTGNATKTGMPKLFIDAVYWSK